LPDGVVEFFRTIPQVLEAYPDFSKASARKVSDLVGYGIHGLVTLKDIDG